MLLGVAALALMLAFASRAGAGVFAYPSSQTIPASGPLPQDSAPAVTMNAAIGEREGAWIVATGAKNVYSWPQWSHDAATAVKIEAAKQRALTLAAG